MSTKRGPTATEFAEAVRAYLITRQLLPPNYSKEDVAMLEMARLLYAHDKAASEACVDGLARDVSGEQRDIVAELLEVAEVAEHGGHPHWADVCRRAKEIIQRGAK